MKNWILIPTFALILAILTGLFFCTNNPWPRAWSSSSVLFTSYFSQIRNLDSSTSYYSHESYILDNIVEPPLAYHYLKRPYELIPQLVENVPEPEYRDKNGNILQGDPDASSVYQVRYTLKIKPGIFFQPHACFGAEKRQLKAEDFRTAVVRLCDPKVASPVYSSISSFLAGMKECSDALRKEADRLDAIREEQGENNGTIQKYPSLPDYRSIPFKGIETPNDYTVVFILTRKYPQFVYWLSMHFFAPIAWEALDYYQNHELIDKGQTYSINPVGTGAYMLGKYDPNDIIILNKNPNYHDARYPDEGEKGDEEKGLLEDRGKRLPFTDTIVYKFEKESIPNWIKFVQGYYDINGDNNTIPTDMMDSAITMNSVTGEMELSPAMEQKNLRLFSNVMMISYYFPINNLDPVLGGLSPQKCALRRALALVLDSNEYINIFRNGAGIISEGILPPGIFGYLPPPERINEEIHTWLPVMKRTGSKEIELARQLMVEAGYPNGLDKNGQPLVIHLDHANAGNPNFKSRFMWLSEKLALLGIRLEERQTDLNRLREQLETGNWQMQFERAWVADYPDPENFLMLFFGPNGIVQSGGKGCNNFNYDSPEFNSIFRKLETMPNGPERQAMIDKANRLLHHDAPVLWTLYPVNTILSHHWLYNYKPNSISMDRMKYLRIAPQERLDYQKTWNHPCFWPIALPLFIIAAILAVAIFRSIKKNLNP